MSDIPSAADILRRYSAVIWANARSAHEVAAEKGEDWTLGDMVQALRDAAAEQIARVRVNRRKARAKAEMSHGADPLTRPVEEIFAEWDALLGRGGAK